MSRNSQLPPRCPLQKKREDIGLLHSKKREDCILDEQPAWFNDLLSDSNGSSSDPYTICNNSGPLSDHLKETETVDSCEPDDDGLGSSYSYGPNSPRRKNKPEKEMVSVFSEYVMQNTPHHLDGYGFVSGVEWSESFAPSAGEVNTGNKPTKCHNRHRSRTRKLEYIAELEKTVDVLQNLGLDLAVRVASVMQHHNALSMENSMLKQLVLRTKQEKIMLDREYQSLKKEEERLKICLAGFSYNKVHINSRSDDRLDYPVDIQNILDMRKLYLN